jgi:RNA polymerase sigma-70 factor (ECF subfamily)
MDKQKDGVEEIVSLFNLYEQKMYGIAFSILNDSYLAEDAVMDAFVRLLEKQYRIDDPASDASTNLIIQVTRHAAIDLYRKNKREQERMNLSDDPASRADARTIETSIGTEIEIKSMIGNLPPKYRDVLYYRFIKDCSTAETAAALTISPGAVRKRQERALNMLRQENDNKGGLLDEYHCKFV